MDSVNTNQDEVISWKTQFETREIATLKISIKDFDKILTLRT